MKAAVVVVALFDFPKDAQCPCDSKSLANPKPKGPKIEKIQDRRPGLKFSSEIENFKRATQQTPIFCGEF